MNEKFEWLKWKCIVGWLIAFLSLVACDLSGENRFGPPARETNGWLRIQGHILTNQLVSIEASSNLTDWSAMAVLDYRILNAANWQIEATNEVFSFLDTAAPSGQARFYRFATSDFSDTNDWKNQALFPNDIFTQSQVGSGESGLRWIKFAIPLREPFRVFYQNSQQYLLHHDFAAQRLEPFVGLSRAAFDQVSLYTNHQEVLLGTVLFPPRADQAEYGIQFAGRDSYPRETVQRFFELVRSTVVAPPEITAFYFPAYEQAEAAAMSEAYLAARGIKISSINRWVAGTQVYSIGWALGRITFIPAGEIAAAYADGRLRPEDILLTDGVPAEVPFVAGIISTVPATPNSHVAILANAYGVPFVYLAGAAEQGRAQQLIGKEVICQASLKAGVGQMLIVDVDGKLDAEFRAALLASKQPLTPNIQPKATFGAFSASTDSLTLQDIQYFGGKAANFGLLRRTVPTNCPVAIAFSFDLWDAFMTQTLANGLTLGAEISNRLSGYSYPPNVADVKTNLAAVRDLIAKKAVFNDAQKQAITNALSVFDPIRKIRFRSSSNAEDGKTFSAAGLYDSYSGCLADDLDGNTSGPCHCDEAEPAERGVFRAMQKVYASFYNDNAFLERLRHGLDESQVGMALLVHRSTPDEEEMANGVATVTLEAPRWFGSPQMKAGMVTQLGAVSVTNPEGNAKPEVTECGEFGGPTLVQSSSLVPLGSHVMAWEDDYTALRDLLFKVYSNYPGVVLDDATKALTLDFEYKKVQPGQLLVKQVRELPAAPTNQTQRFLLGESTTYWVYQREGSGVFANHHLKCNLTLASKNLVLNDTGLAQCFYTNSSFEYRDGTRMETLTGSPATWSNATHSVTLDPQRGTVVTDTWTVGSGAGQRAFELTSVIPNSDSSATPFLVQAELRKWLRVTYATAVPTVDWQGNGTNTLEEEVQLVMQPDLAALLPDHGRTLSTTNGLTFQLSFLNPTNAAGPPLGVDPNVWGDYPAAISPWIHARITGLTAEPLVLTGYYSQSAAAGHKYRHSEFVFEPRLEPNLPSSQLQDLSTRNIQSIWVSCDGFLDGAPAQLEVMVSLLGSDGVFRKP